MTTPAPAVPEEKAKQVRRILTTILWLNLGVLAVKIVVWLLSGALSVLAESMHSLLDAANNVFALTVARLAARGPDAEHPYGHGKFETLGALALVGVLSVTVVELLRQAYSRFMVGGPTGVEVSPIVLGLMAFTLVAGFVVSRYERAEGRRLGSPLLLADAAHTRADVWATGAVLAGLVTVRAGYPLADPITTALVAGVIAYTGWSIVRETVPVLVDERAVHPLRIETLARRVEGVRSAYAIRSRGRPGEIFAELTIAVDPSLDVAASHGIADAVEVCLVSALTAREVVVHVEPAEDAPTE